MTTWRRHPQALSRSSADQVVVLPVGHDEPVVLSSTGAAVWDALAEPHSVEDLAGQLAATFDGDPQRIRGDVERFLHELGEQDMVTCDP